jgi:5-methylthioadenosine/S-adenosylhomocysteine deaminase
LRGGVTTIVDHGMGPRAITAAVHRAANETGIRYVSSTGVYDQENFSVMTRTPGLEPGIDAALRAGERHIADCQGFARTTPSLALANMQSNTGDMIKPVAQFCRDRNILF